MSKPAKKSSTAAPARAPAATATPKTTGEPKIKKADSGSKQSRVVALLSSPDGTTIAAMMKATGWQQHSVRGFLAGVLRRKLKLKLGSKKIAGTRVYRIDRSGGAGIASKQSKRHAA
jgi:hypothetical protein